MIKTVWSMTLHVSDMKRAVKFYEETSGLEKKYEFSSYAGFECGRAEIGLIPASVETRKTSLMSPFEEFLVDDVDKFCDRLSRAGVEFFEELHDKPWGWEAGKFCGSRRQHAGDTTDRLEEIFQCVHHGRKGKT